MSKLKEKIECLNPNTRRKMNIDSETYNLFSKAIYHTLKKEKRGITYTEIVDGVKKCFKEAIMSVGRTVTAPKTIPQINTISRAANKAGKKSLLRRSIRFWIKVFNKLNDVVAASGPEINQVMLLKTNDTFVLTCVR